jgi:hypothetical protein
MVALILSQKEMRGKHKSILSHFSYYLICHFISFVTPELQPARPLPKVHARVCRCSAPIMDSKPRLSCEQCRRRKTRCNKEMPCSSCKTSGLRCEFVLRARLPRGRSGKIRSKNAMLESRVARIEELLEKVMILRTATL